MNAFIKIMRWLNRYDDSPKALQSEYMCKYRPYFEMDCVKEEILCEGGPAGTLKKVTSYADSDGWIDFNKQKPEIGQSIKALGLTDKSIINGTYCFEDCSGYGRLADEEESYSLFDTWKPADHSEDKLDMVNNTADDINVVTKNDIFLHCGCSDLVIEDGSLRPHNICNKSIPCVRDKLTIKDPKVDKEEAKGCQPDSHNFKIYTIDRRLEMDYITYECIKCGVVQTRCFPPQKCNCIDKVIEALKEILIIKGQPHDLLTIGKFQKLMMDVFSKLKELKDK